MLSHMQHMRASNMHIPDPPSGCVRAGKGGGVMLKLDELSGEVAGLEKLRSNLEMIECMRKLEEEPDTWHRLQVRV